MGAVEHLQCLKPDPSVHRLLAGAGDLPVLSQCDPVPFTCLGKRHTLHSHGRRR